MAEYLVFCTFDLSKATAEHYDRAYQALAQVGLTRVHAGDGGTKGVIPTTSAMGLWTGPSSAVVRDTVLQQLKAELKARQIHSAEIFITVGTEWAWVGSKL